MGNNVGKKRVEDPKEKVMDILFITISNGKGFITKNDLKKIWSAQIDEDLYNDIEMYLFSGNSNELNSHTFKALYVNICRGTTDQRVDVIMKLLKCNNEISGSRLSKFVISILNSILIIQENKSAKKCDSWVSRMACKDVNDSLKICSLYYLDKINKTDADTFTREDLLIVSNSLDDYLRMVFNRLYNTEESDYYTQVLPKWKYNDVDNGKTLEQLSILDLVKILFLNNELPLDLRSHWRLLFGTEVHGESFTRLMAQISNKGPTIILLKDKQGYTFGGFAPASWKHGPNFFGDNRSFLFTLEPKMRIFAATNFNDNYQYMNVNQQTMPNGLGMGGKLEYFGFFLDAEFGRGHCNESCTTYRGFKMMSSSKNFEFSHLEVWGVGPLPAPDESEYRQQLGKENILDNNLEAKALLELAGKPTYSEGFWESADD